MTGETPKSKPLTYYLRERQADGTLWKQTRDPEDVPQEFHSAAAREYEALGAVLAGMSGVESGCARWAVDENGAFILGCINTNNARLRGMFTPARVKEYLALGYLKTDPFKE